MKTCIPLLLLIVFFQFSQAQNKASNLLENEMIKLLETDGFLLSKQQIACEDKDCRPLAPWKNKKERDKAIDNDTKLRTLLVSKFLSPSFCDGKAILPTLSFRDSKYARLGSYIISNNDFSIINPSNEPILPVLLTGNQLSIPSPSSDKSNYILNLTTNKLLSLGASANMESKFGTYFDAKLRGSANMNNSKVSQLSMGAGNFVNILAQIYKNAIAGGQADAFSFNALYDLWNVHKSVKIKNEDKIISSFDGVCYYASTGVKSTEEITAEAEIKSSGNFPFLRYEANGSGKWVNSNTIGASSNTYNIYMLATPAMQAIPTVDDILKNWGNLNKNLSISLPSNPIIPTNSPLIVKATFGPISNNQILPLIKIDKEFSLKHIASSGQAQFVKDLRLITDDEKLTNDRGYYTFNIEVWRDEVYIEQNIGISDEIVAINFPIRIYIDNPINGKFIEKVYDPIRIKTERYPTPYYLDTNGSINLIPNIDDPDDIVYKGMVEFNVPSGNITVLNAPKPIKVKDVLGLPAKIDEDFKKDLKTATFSLKSPNKYDMIIRIPKANKYFDINNRSFEIDLALEFSAKDNLNTTTYNRKLPIRLIAPKEQTKPVNAISNVIFKDNSELVTSLNDGAKTKGGKTIGEIKLPFNKPDGGLDILSFIEELKKQTNLILLPDNTYSIDVVYINLNKVNN